MTLRCIADIEKPDKGRIIVGGISCFDAEKKMNLLPKKETLTIFFEITHYFRIGR